MSAITSDKARFVALCLFVALVFLTGGGSRHDIVSLAILRPGAMFFAVYAACLITRDQWRAIRIPLFMLSALIVLALVQLLPLPPGLWGALPGRELQVETGAALGLQELWRPFSLVPSRTQNAVFAMAVPLAALLLYAIQAQQWRNRTSRVLLIGAAASAGLGLLQSVLPSVGLLYPYEITNAGSAVGLFSNRNHQAVLMALMVVMAAYYAANGRSQAGRGSSRLLLTQFALALIALSAIITGSRAGLLCTGIALIAAVIFILKSSLRPAAQPAQPQRGKRRSKVQWQKYLPLFQLGLPLIAGLAVIAYSRTSAFSKLFGRGDQAELRGEILPYLRDLAVDYFPWGSGLGSFEFVYRQLEPDHLLQPSYLNNAHNDWMQVIIEGGLPMALILLVAIAWIARLAVSVWRGRGQADAAWRGKLLAIASVVILMVSGLFEYALRTPTIMMWMAFVLAIAVLPETRIVQTKRRSSGVSLAMSDVLDGFPERARA